MRPKLVLTVCALLLLLAAATCVEAKRKAESKLPDCDAARKAYKAGKLYDVFGLDRKASDKEIRKAFKKMSIKCHPDKDRESKKANDNFIAIGAAYETLSNAQERAHYDSGGSTGGPGGAGGNPFGGGGGQHTWTAKDFGDVDISKIFSQFFKTMGGGGGGDEDDRDFARMFGGSFQFGGGGGGGGGNSGGARSGFPRQYGQAGQQQGYQHMHQHQHQQPFGGGGGNPFGSFGGSKAGKPTKRAGGSSTTATKAPKPTKTSSSSTTTTSSSKSQTNAFVTEKPVSSWAKAEQSSSGAYSFVNKNARKRSKRS